MAMTGSPSKEKGKEMELQKLEIALLFMAPDCCRRNPSGRDSGQQRKKLLDFM